MNKTNGILLINLFIVISHLSIAQSTQEIKSLSYCTEIGIFNLLIDHDEVAGTYSLSHKNTLGAVWGEMSDNKMKGRWMDPDGEGEIELIFEEDLQFFTANYRSDDNPEEWYINQWHGAQRPDDATNYSYKGQSFKCN